METHLIYSKVVISITLGEPTNMVLFSFLQFSFIVGVILEDDSEEAAVTDRLPRSV
jgi:hypothetical protein